MKFITVVSLFLFLMMDPLFSQDTIYVYYNKDWKEISDKNEAEYYRKAFLNNNKVWSVLDYYKSDTLQMSGSYKAKDFQLKNGFFNYYFENGKKMSVAFYQNNKIEGLMTNWYENGQKEFERNFKNDIPNGRSCSWYENGGKKFEGEFVAGNAQGLWKYWHETGEIKAEGKYLANAKDGLWKYWYPNGQLSSEEVYKKGIISSVKAYHENGQLKYSGNFVNGKSHGEWTYWNVDGRVVMKGNFNKGNRDGEWHRYFREGYMKLNYKNGLLLSSNKLGSIVRSE